MITETDRLWQKILLYNGVDVQYVLYYNKMVSEERELEKTSIENQVKYFTKKLENENLEELEIKQTFKQIKSLKEEIFKSFMKTNEIKWTISNKARNIIAREKL